MYTCREHVGERQSQLVRPLGNECRTEPNVLQITLRHIVKTFSIVINRDSVVRLSRVGSCSPDIVSAGQFFTPHCLEFILWKLTSAYFNIGAYPRAPSFAKMLVRYWGFFGLFLC